jgi:peptidoglycan/LPS O-acetylase OafA/YrhL
MPGTIIIANAVIETWIIIAVLLAALVLFRRKTSYGDLLPLAATQELKGVAILGVLFGHIGYFLVDDNRFLFPLSIGAGVGVNIFLFLSGYGLTLGMMKKPLPALTFYRKRAVKIFIPFWLALIGFFVLDALVLHRTYSTAYIARSLLGFFPRADMADDVNSVFWYITWILFYYALMPLVFIRGRAWLSALILLVLGQALVWWDPIAIDLVTRLYKVHTVAFPLGMLLAWALFESREQPNPLAQWLRERRGALSGVAYFGTLAVLGALIVYSAYDSGIGESEWKEQTMSLVTTLALVALFALKRVELRALTLIGLFSYEIYLLHWPLVSRYDVIYRALPAAPATFAYLGVFIGLGWLIQRAAGWINEHLEQKPAPSAA